MKPKRTKCFDWILLGIACLSAFLNVFNIWNDTNANSYYTSAVTSMLQSFHNFFFASFDPAGFITVDKPPITFWVQTIFAYFFGVHGWSVILPQALAGVGSVLLLYFLVKPTFGKTAARFSSLVMACTPIAVAVSRTNNIDSLLVFTLLLATWMLFRGIHNQKVPWILGAFAMIGVGFNMKMLQAYMVVPAFYLFYLFAFKTPWKKKLTILAGATVIMVGISLSWAVIVDSIPQENRPYIGSSQTNSVLELAFGYNGISRLTGNQGGGPGTLPNLRDMKKDGRNMPTPPQMQNGGDMPTPPEGLSSDGKGNQGSFPEGGGKPQGQGGSGMFNTGQAGPLRLFQTELSGQISWLLPFVAFASVGLLAGIRRKKALTAKQKESLFWLAWLIPGMAFFSVAGFFHQYYLIMLAAPIAALTGAGWVELWNHYRNKKGWKGSLLPIALLATTAFELFVLYPYQQQIGSIWSMEIGVACVGLALILFLFTKKKMVTSIAAKLGLLILLVAPLYWSVTPLLYGVNSVMPAAGPSQQGVGLKQGMGNGSMSNINQQLLDYVSKNNTGEKYLFATTDANSVSSYIIKTGKAVMAMGGFQGNDPALTVEKLKQMVANKEVKYFLISSGSDARGGSSNNEVLNWIRANSTEVPQDQWQSNTSKGGAMGMGGEKTLYQIKNS